MNSLPYYYTVLNVKISFSVLLWYIKIAAYESVIRFDANIPCNLAIPHILYYTHDKIKPCS
jgi:hypothetical protein